MERLPPDLAPPVPETVGIPRNLPLVLALLVLASGVAGVAYGISNLVALELPGATFPMPGAVNLTLGSGAHVVFVEGEEGELLALGDLACTLVGPTGELSLATPSGSTSIGVGARRAVVVYAFDAPEPGAHRLACVDGEGEEEPRVMSVGRDPTPGLVTGILSILGGLGGVVLGIGLLVWAVRRKRRAGARLA